MILVDTSVWVDHLRRGDTQLSALLESSQVVSHPFVVGELACGTLGPRSDILDLLNALPKATTATHHEAMHFLTEHRLSGRGVGYVDLHLLASAAIDGSRVWTRDKALSAESIRLGLSHHR